MYDRVYRSTDKLEFAAFERLPPENWRNGRQPRSVHASLFPTKETAMADIDSLSTAARASFLNAVSRFVSGI